LIASRLLERHNHFAGVSILKSQFDTLEEPQHAIVVDVAQSPGEIIEEIERRLGLA
jgi:gluconokinase